MLNKMINPDLSGKKQILILGLLLIAVCVFTQTPEWHWATSAGGSDTDAGNSIALDDAGNKYITGCFKGTVSFGSYTLTSEITSYDFFVAKTDANGNWLWAEGAGSSGYEYGNSIAVDAAGSAYVTGWFCETVSFGPHTLTAVDNSRDIFVAKVSDPVNVEESELPVSHNYQLTNYPNPFTGETTISFSLTTNLHEKARIEIYNIRGQRVDEIAIGKEQTSVNWQRTNQANGVYFYKLVVDGNPVDTKKMILLK